MSEELLLPKFGSPKECMKKHPKGSYVVVVEDTRFIGGKWIEKRKVPLYHVVKVIGALELEGQFGHCGLDFKYITTHKDKSEALNRAHKLNLEREAKK